MLYNIKLLKKFKLINKKLAFTLAEVLIVLGVIGIVAEMTIPTLMQDVQYKANVTALKKAYSTLAQAYTMAVNDNGTPDEWGLTADGTGSALMMRTMSKYMRVLKDCGNAGNCMPSDYNRLHTTSQNFSGATSLAQMQLADGSIWAVGVTNGSCNGSFGSTQALQNTCGYFYIDVNGLKSPNTVGKDLFLIYVTKYGMIPTGTSNEGAYTFAGDCVSGNANGWGCTAWVIYNENQDYLKCPGSLSWGGQTKCN